MSIKLLHIELTNKCYLKCPLCSRTTFVEKFKQKQWKNHDLDLDTLKNFVDIDLTNISIQLTGNYGDPIYHPKFFDFIRWFKSKNARIQLCTNGSYKSKDWWEELVSLLSDNDYINFAIDGTKNTFTQYRINGDWDSIEQGLAVVGKSNVQSVWRFIPFSFNEHDIENAKLLAKQYNIKIFQIIKSNRFDDALQWRPSNKMYESDDMVKRIELRRIGNDIELNPKCLDQKHHFITATGYYTPCCFVAEHNFYYKTVYHKNNIDYDIKRNTLSKILSKEKNNLKDFLREKHKVCQYNCPKI